MWSKIIEANVLRKFEVILPMKKIHLKLFYDGKCFSFRLEKTIKTIESVNYFGFACMRALCIVTIFYC